MDLLSARELKEEDIAKLVAEGVEENLHLEYKALGALEKNDYKKKEISKDVSSFANSDGGLIIYGVKEFDQLEKRHLPEGIEGGYNPNDISKEWLEDVINSRIKPKIQGIIIIPVRLINNTNIYVVNIPKSSSAHQASDYRYYKRYNFESIPMEDFEVRDVMNRSKYPLLEPIFHTQKHTDGAGKKSYELKINLINRGSMVVTHFELEISLPASMVKDVRGVFKNKIENRVARVAPAGGAQFIEVVYRKLYLINPIERIVIFPDQEFQLLPDPVGKSSIECVLDPNIDGVYLFDNLYWKLYADNMPFKEGQVRLSSLIMA